MSNFYLTFYLSFFRVTKQEGKMLTKLKKIVKLRGYAYVAYRLGYRDTAVIKKWVLRKRIPKEKEFIVNNFVNEIVH